MPRAQKDLNGNVPCSWITKDVERWYDNVARGSDVTAKVYLRRLRGFCESMNKTPSELITKDEKALFDLLLDFVSSEEKRGMTGSYIHISSSTEDSPYRRMTNLKHRR